MDDDDAVHAWASFPRRIYLDTSGRAVILQESRIKRPKHLTYLRELERRASSYRGGQLTDVGPQRLVVDSEPLGRLIRP